MHDDGLGLQSSVTSVSLAGLVEKIVKVIKSSLASIGQHSSSECVALDDTQALLADDIDEHSVSISVLHASTYPEASARELKIELEEKIKNKMLLKRRREEERLRAVGEAKMKKYVAFVWAYPFKDVSLFCMLDEEQKMKQSLRNLTADALGTEVASLGPEYTS